VTFSASALDIVDWGRDRQFHARFRQHLCTGHHDRNVHRDYVHGNNASKPFTITVQTRLRPASRCPPTSRAEPRAPPVQR